MIRTAAISDAEEIARIHVEAWRVAYREIVDAGHLDSLSIPVRTMRWREILSESGRVTLVFEEGGQLLGWASHGPSRDDDFNGGEILAIYVCPRHWGRGVGAALMAAIEGAHPPGCELSVWVLAENYPAIAFYRDMGHHPDGTKRQIRIGPSLLAELRFRKTLGGRNVPASA